MLVRLLVSNDHSSSVDFYPRHLPSATSLQSMDLQARFCAVKLKLCLHHRKTDSLRVDRKPLLQKQSISMIVDISSGFQALNAKILMENSERIGRIESSLIGKKHPIKPLLPLPLVAAMQKALPSDPSTLLTKALLLRDGCVSVKGVLSTSLADKLFSFVNTEKENSEAQVRNGTAIYDDRFGAVNNRLFHEVLTDM